jgi:hypothetical protein
MLISCRLFFGQTRRLRRAANRPGFSPGPIFPTIRQFLRKFAWKNTSAPDEKPIPCGQVFDLHTAGATIAVPFPPAGAFP